MFELMYVIAIPLAVLAAAGVVGDLIHHFYL